MKKVHCPLVMNTWLYPAAIFLWCVADLSNLYIEIWIEQETLSPFHEHLVIFLCAGCRCDHGGSTQLKEETLL